MSGWFLGGTFAALAWWGYQAFTWLKTGMTLDWYFGTFLLTIYRVPDNSPAQVWLAWAECSANPSSAVLGCDGAPPWAGVGKIVDWWLTLDVGFGLIVSATVLGMVVASFILIVWEIPVATGWKRAQPYAAPFLDPLASGWRRWVQPAHNSLDAFLESRLGMSLVLIFFGALLVRGCLAS